ncbi:transcriptional regulator [Phytoactinopolyspora halotolerans]|nr:transcriptional regulator [Phytoactinopolyspora halotolerans]
MNDNMSPEDREFAKAVGRRLRKLRMKRQLSMQAVQDQSGGTISSAVIGSYERGERVPSVVRLAQIADFYGVPVDSLVSGREGGQPAANGDDGKVVLDLDALRKAPEEAQHLVRFVNGVQQKRGDFGGSILTIRGDDVWMVSSMYEITPAELREKMAAWGVIASDA